MKRTYDGRGFERPASKRQRVDYDAPYNEDHDADQNGQLNQMGIKDLVEIQDSINREQDPTKFKQKVCSFWLKGKCKLGNKCNYLHADIEEKKPICNFFKVDGRCPNGDNCPYRHVRIDEPDVISTYEPCPYFDRGFCYKGDKCRFFEKHVQSFMAQSVQKQKICSNYLAGFCPYGSKCFHKHLKLIIIEPQSSLKQLANYPDHEDWVQHTQGPFNPKSAPFPSQNVVCHNCGQKGHKSTYCIEDRVNAENIPIDSTHANVMCYSCNQYGHYANHCPMKHQAQRKGGPLQPAAPKFVVPTIQPKQEPNSLVKQIEKKIRTEQQPEQPKPGPSFKSETVLTGKNFVLRDLRMMVEPSQYRKVPFTFEDVNTAVQQLSEQIKQSGNY